MVEQCFTSTRLNKAGFWASFGLSWGHIYIYCNTIILHHDIVYIPPTIIISLSSHIYEATPCSKTKIVTIGNNMETKTHLVLKCSEDLKKQRVETTASDSPNIDQEAPASALNPWSRSVWPMQRPCPSWLTGWYRSSAGEGGLGMVSRAETKEVWKKTNEKPWKSHRFFGGNHRNIFFFHKKCFFAIFFLGNDQLKWCKLLHIDVLVRSMKIGRNYITL